MEKEILEEIDEMFRMVMSQDKESPLKRTLHQIFSWNWRPKYAQTFKDTVLGTPAIVILSTALCLPLILLLKMVVPTPYMTIPAQISIVGVLFAYFMAREIKNWLTVPAETGPEDTPAVTQKAIPSQKHEQNKSVPCLFIHNGYGKVPVTLLDEQTSREWPTPICETYGKLQWSHSSPFGGVSDDDISRRAIATFELLFKFIAFSICAAYLYKGPKTKQAAVINKMKAISHASHGHIGEAMRASLEGLEDCDSEEWLYLKQTLISPMLEAEPTPAMMQLLEEMPTVLPSSINVTGNPYTATQPVITEHIFQAMGQIRNKTSHFSINGAPGNHAYLLTTVVNDLLTLLSPGLKSIRILHVHSIELPKPDTYLINFDNFFGPTVKPLEVTTTSSHDLPISGGLYLGKPDGTTLFKLTPFLQPIQDDYGTTVISFFSRFDKYETEYQCYEKNCSRNLEVVYKQELSDLITEHGS